MAAAHDDVEVLVAQQLVDDEVLVAVVGVDGEPGRRVPQNWPLVTTPVARPASLATSTMSVSGSSSRSQPR
ncbi:hypothetical protein [Georgenia sp. Z1491]|uniref:hypothetical protein n=1 Tax=Georgenia sp. Z1491 TaxID=3416707 RepID=UPI003CF7F722